MALPRLDRAGDYLTRSNPFSPTSSANPYNSLGRKLYQAATGGYGSIRATGALGGKDSDFGPPSYPPPTPNPGSGYKPNPDTLAGVPVPTTPYYPTPSTTYKPNPDTLAGITVGSTPLTMPTQARPADIVVKPGTSQAAGLKDSVTGGGGYQAQQPTGNVPVRSAGDIPVQSTDDLINLITNSYKVDNSSSNDWGYLVSQGLNQFAEYAKQREAALRAQAEQEGKQMDPASLAEIQRIKDAVQQQQGKIKEWMNSRGILDSGITLGEMDRANKAGNDQIAQLQLARANNIRSRLQSALDALWGNQFGYAQNYARSMQADYWNKRKEQQDLVDRLLQANRDAQDNAKAEAGLTGYYNGKPTFQREQMNVKASTVSPYSTDKTPVAEEVAGLHRLVKSGVVTSIADGDSMIDQALRSNQTDAATADYLKRYLRSLGLPAGRTSSNPYYTNPHTYLNYGG